MAVYCPSEKSSPGSDRPVIPERPASGDCLKSDYCVIEALHDVIRVFPLSLGAAAL